LLRYARNDGEIPKRHNDRHTREGGYPVRCGLSIQSLLSLEYWIVRPSAQLRTRRTMTAKHDFAFSRRIAPEACWKLPSFENGGCRECRVLAAPAVSCAMYA